MIHNIGSNRFSSAGLRCVVRALVLAVVGACGGSGPNGGGPSPGSGMMTATIDGQAFASDPHSAMATATSRAPGTYVMQGSRVTSPTDYLTLTVTLFNIAATGTYPLGMTGVMFGGIGNVFQTTPPATVASWDTPLSGASGTVTVSTLTASRIAGTFSFTAAPSTGATSIRTVTNGSFDLPVTGSVGTLPANAGSSLTARVNGAPWTASAVAVVGHTSSALAFGGGTTLGNTTYQMAFTLGPLAGPGTYPVTNIGPTTLGVITVSPSQSWDSRLGGTGSIVVTELTAARVKGTFTATLPPSSGTGPSLTIDNGSFNVGLP
jgi:hypothetical protein